MKSTCPGLTLLLTAFAAVAQAPVEDLTGREQAIQRGQQATGAAYRELRQAQHEARLAEQDFINAQDAQRAAQQHADEMKRQLDAAKKALDAAKAKETQARSRYDEELKDVDRAFERPSTR